MCQFVWLEAGNHEGLSACTKNTKTSEVFVFFVDVAKRPSWFIASDVGSR